MIDLHALRDALPDSVGVAVVDTTTGEVVAVDRGPHAEGAMTRAVSGMTAAMLALDEAAGVLGLDGPGVARVTDGDRSAVGLRFAHHRVVALERGSAEGRLQATLTNALHRGAA